MYRKKYQYKMYGDVFLRSCLGDVDRKPQENVWSCPSHLSSRIREAQDGSACTNLMSYNSRVLEPASRVPFCIILFHLEHLELSASITHGIMICSPSAGMMPSNCSLRVIGSEAAMFISARTARIVP